MSGGAWRLSLRGAKISVFLLSAISVMIFISMFNSRPASAESFLLKTVKCVAGVLSGSDCRTATPAQPAPVAPAPTPAQTPVTPAAPAPSSNTPAQTQQAATVTQPVMVAPIEPTIASVNAAPELPTPTHRATHGATTSDYAAYIFNTKGVQGDDMDTFAGIPLESSKEGWRIFGISWYWLAAILITVVAGVMWLRHGKFKNIFSVVKEA